MNKTLLEQPVRSFTKIVDQQFLTDVLKGLSAKKKYLDSKYFYNAEGDRLFQAIMDCPEYYLTKCEMEIFSQQTNRLASAIFNHSNEFDIVELGAGDATKSSFLLEELLQSGKSFTYYPVDISTNVIRLLENQLPQKFPSLHLHGLNGEYFPMLEQAKVLSKKTKVVLFLGSNIGNIAMAEAEAFCASLRSHLSVGDLVLIGFDLKKDPGVILNAYNDEAGYTRDFNLNLLQRINDELGGNFNLQNFEHKPVYYEATGACESFLVSSTQQTVRVADHQFYFSQQEKIYMEISQKYTNEQIQQLAINTGFTTVQHFNDSKNWFVDVIWQCI